MADVDFDLHADGSSIDAQIAKWDEQIDQLAQKVERLFSKVNKSDPAPLYGQATGVDRALQIGAQPGGIESMGSPALTQAVRKLQDAQQQASKLDSGSNNPNVTSKRDADNGAREIKSDREETKKALTVKQQLRQEDERSLQMKKASFSYNLGQSMQTGASAYQYMQAAQGNVGPLARSLGTSVLQAARATSVGAAALEGGAAGAAEGAGGAGGIAGALGALGPVGAIIAGIAAVSVGAYVAGGQLGADAQLQKQTLGAGVVGASDQTVRDLSAHATNMGMDPSAYLKMAHMLGMAGVHSKDMTSATDGTASLATLARIDPMAAAGITANLYAGGMSTKDINKSYAALFKELGGSKAPVDRLVASFQDLQKVAGNVGLNAAGLTAAQNYLGSGVSVGAVLGGGLGLIGTSRLAASSVLGVSEAQYKAAEYGGAGGSVDPAKMISMVSSYAQRSGLSGDMLQNLLGPQGIGVLDFSSLSAKQSDSLLRSLMTQNPGAITKDEQKLLKLASGGATNPAQAFIAAATKQADLATSPLKHLAQNEEAAAIALGLFIRPSTGVAAPKMAPYNPAKTHPGNWYNRPGDASPQSGKPASGARSHAPHPTPTPIAPLALPTPNPH